MKYARIDQHRDRYSVSRLLGVSSSGYCQWRGRSEVGEPKPIPRWAPKLPPFIAPMRQL